jgi:uncharacterized protein
MREDNQLLLITHLSQLLSLFTVFGGLIVPLILWSTQKETVYKMDAQGKEIINFQLSMLVLSFICIPLIFALGLGIIGLIIIGILSLIFPIINGIKVGNGESPSYPFTFKFIS